MHPELSEQLVTALLDLPDMFWLYIYVYNGTLNPKLGALKFTYFAINHYCMVGALPPNLLYGWRGLTRLEVTRQGDALDFVDAAVDTCGISGPIPLQWTKTRTDFVTDLPRGLLYIDLSGNQLGGSLPGVIGGVSAIDSLENLFLQHNRFTGRTDPSKVGLLFNINLQHNDLSGALPAQFHNLEGRLAYLFLDYNPQLSGCVPLTPYTTVSYVKTQVDGRCADRSAKEVQQRRQRRAISRFFLPSLNVSVDNEFRSMLNAVRKQIVDKLGSSIQRGQTSKTFQENHRQGEQRGFCRVSVSLIDGIEFITSIEVGASGVAAAAGLNLTQLPQLLQRLPQLQVFSCSRCWRAGPAELPSALPASAPNLLRLNLGECNLIGQIPSTFGSHWNNLTVLDLAFNGLSGPLPPTLANLRSLTMLELIGNTLTGTLPIQWRDMPGELYVGLRNNTAIMGEIPQSFRRSRAYFDLYATSISGCVPPGVLGLFFTLQTPMVENSAVVQLITCPRG
ncbi:hypothetical protein COO60DRAFT_1534010 [Scenedesmus sp. NREL 46B-D3]|nr:hypothetical protein COO60DRAFT_1534010 [Scenedesmus sp. NREL 46B-D3]